MNRSLDDSIVLRFSNNSETMVAIKTLKAIGIKPRLIARPHDIANESDLCLSIERAFEDQARTALRDAHLLPAS